MMMGKNSSISAEITQSALQSDKDVSTDKPENMTELLENFKVSYQRGQCENVEVRPTVKLNLTRLFIARCKSDKERPDIRGGAYSQ